MYNEPLLISAELFRYCPLSRSAALCLRPSVAGSYADSGGLSLLPLLLPLFYCSDLSISPLLKETKKRKIVHPVHFHRNALFLRPYLSFHFFSGMFSVGSAMRQPFLQVFSIFFLLFIKLSPLFPTAFIFIFSFISFLSNFHLFSPRLGK